MTAQRWTIDELWELEHTPTADLVQFIPGEPSCPECKAGKHDNCDGGAWEFELDVPTHCRCWTDRHGRSLVGGGEDPVLAEAADRAEAEHYRHTRIGDVA